MLLAENVAAGGNNSAGERVPQVLRPDLQEAADGGEEALLLDRGAVLFLYKKKVLMLLLYDPVCQLVGGLVGRSVCLSEFSTREVTLPCSNWSTR